MELPTLAISASMTVPCGGSAGGSPVDDDRCDAERRCCNESRAPCTLDRPLATAACALPSAAAVVAGTLPVRVNGLTVARSRCAVGIDALNVFMVNVKVFVNGPNGSNSAAVQPTSTPLLSGDK